MSLQDTEITLSFMRYSTKIQAKKISAASFRNLKSYVYKFWCFLQAHCLLRTTNIF